MEKIYKLNPIANKFIFWMIEDIEKIIDLLFEIQILYPLATLVTIKSPQCCLC